MSDPGEIEFIAWKDITLFHNVVKNVKSARDWYAQASTSTTEGSEELIEPALLKTIEKPVIYKGKVKLHGSNAGVALCGNQIRAQSRTQFIDKSGFGRIVFEKNEAYWRSLVVPGGPQRFTVFGEYCGLGVQKGVALAKLKGVLFAVFAIDINSHLIVEPADIEAFLTKGGTVALPSDVHVLPWYPGEFLIDLSKDTADHLAGVQKVLDSIDTEVQKIDTKDPWVAELFNVDGPGEGLVLYPVSLLESHEAVPEYKTLTRTLFGHLAFKAKGEKHRVVEAKKSVSIDPEKAANAEAFAKLMCPRPRLEQGASTVGGYEMRFMKDFLAWMAKDVQKEGQHELDASGLQWSDVTGPISKLSSAWYALEVKAKAAAKEKAESS